MTIKVFKDSFDNCYLVNIYKQYETYFNFDFYPVFDLGDESYSTLRSFNKVYLDTFSECLERNRISPDFSFFFRIDLSDQRFNTDEILWDENYPSILKEASEFCRSYWLENYAKTNLSK